MDAILIEEKHQRQSGRHIFSLKIFEEFITLEVTKTLIKIENGHHLFPSKRQFTLIWSLVGVPMAQLFATGIYIIIWTLPKTCP